MTSRDPQECCEEVRSAILATAWLLVMFTDAGVHFMQYIHNIVQTVETDELAHISVITRV